MKMLEENVQEYIWDFRVGEEFFRQKQNQQIKN